MEWIAFSEFKKIELKVGKIVSAEDVAGKDKLYKLSVDLGDKKINLVAGVKEFYKKEELKGKNIVVVSNLQPAKIAGIESEGMLLAAVDRAANKLVLVTTDKELPAGTRVE